jgi:hypothetical protein
MTEDEWDATALIIDKCWRGGLDETAGGAYFLMLKDYGAEEVQDALKVIAQNGKPFIPAVAEILAEVQKQTEPEVPPWSVVWAHLQKALAKPQEDAMEYLDRIHPLIATFLSVEGHEKLRYTEFYDDQYGGIRIAELKARWEEFLTHGVDQVRRGRALGGGRPTRLDAGAILGIGDGTQPQIESGE